MKKIDQDKLHLIHGGAKCIYHYILATVSLGNPFFIIANVIYGNDVAVVECWNNSHSE